MDAADFLLRYPLYQAWRFELPGDQGYRAQKGALVPDRLSDSCPDPKCQAAPATTWALLAPSGDEFPWKVGPGLYLHYGCGLCQTATRHYWVCVEVARDGKAPNVTTRVTYRKIGQWPAWSIEPPKAVAKQLGAEDTEFYRKGLVCLSQSYGLGAVGYFRRVVENTTNGLLDQVEKLAQAQADQDTLAAIAEARTRRAAADKLAIVASHLPPALRLYNHNPLAQLHKDFSVGLHGKSDEECVAIALGLRGTLDYLFDYLGPTIERAQEFQKTQATRERPDET